MKNLDNPTKRLLTVREAANFLGISEQYIRNSMAKNAERPFNLIKHRDGLEPLRPKGIHNANVVAGIANITTLLIEISGYRRKKQVKEQATTIPFEFMKQAA